MSVGVQISHNRGMRIVIFRRINCNEEQQVINYWFFSWFSTEIGTEIDIFINTPKIEFFDR